MKYLIQKLPKSIVETTFFVEHNEYQPFLEQAATQLSLGQPLPGFRPGKAPYELIKQRLGEAKILEAAIPWVARKFFNQVVVGAKLEVVGEPSLEILKSAPGETLEYKLVFAVLPSVVLGDWKKIRVAKKIVNVDEALVDKALLDLRKLQTKEVAVQRVAGAGDKVVVDMEMSRNGAAIEGGSAKNHAIYLGEKYYIPGLADKLVGVGAGETREFSLEFPREHYQKSLAGELVDFRVRVLSVLGLALPEADDALAQGLGQKTMAGLRLIIKKNLQAEADQKEVERQTVVALEKIVESSSFGDLPEILINSEIEKMLEELQRSLAKSGADFQNYLSSIKKSLGELKLDFAPGATKRVRVALALKTLAAEEGVAVEDAELSEEVGRQKSAYGGGAETQKQISSPEYAEYLRNALRNKKTVRLVLATVVK